MVSVQVMHDVGERVCISKGDRGETFAFVFNGTHGAYRSELLFRLEYMQHTCVQIPI